MNKSILMGRLVRDPQVTFPQNENGTTIARYTLAVDRPKRRDAKEGDQTADFIQCVAFGKAAEFVSNYLHQGAKILVTGRIQTGSYTNKDGVKVYTTDVIVESHEFCERANQNGNGGAQPQAGQQPQGSQRTQPQGGQRTQPQPGAYQNNNQGGYNGYQNNAAPQQRPQPSAYQNNNQGGYNGYQNNAAPQQAQPQAGQQPGEDFGFGGFDEDIPFN